jgi:predicted RNase H-like HicB family nuclease
MNHYRYIPIKKNVHDHRDVFRVELAQKGNGDWVAWIAILPGCAAWGYSKDEALHALSEMARVYVRRLIDRGVQIPEEVETVNTPIVAVAI